MRIVLVSTESEMMSLHLHFGAGALGLGAVLPVLSREQILVVVQQVRRSGLKWDKYVKSGAICLGRAIEPAGECEYQRSRTGEMPCRRVKKAEGAVSKRMLPKNDGDDILLLVDNLDQVGPILRHASSLSCSLRDGQRALAKVLLNNKPGELYRPVLAFENTVNGHLKEVCGRQSCRWRLRHVLTDRICGKRIEDDELGKIVVPCEPFLRIVTSDEDSTRAVFDSELVTLSGAGDAARPIRLVSESSLEFHRNRKRWTVNSLHETLALFARSRLKQRGISPRGQFLPQTIAWFLDRDPILDHAVRLYIRLQAVRLVLECRKEKTAVAEFYETNDEQELYDTFVAEGKRTFSRMREFSDRLGRLIDEERIDLELKKYDEHITSAMEFVRENEDEIRKCHLLGRPNPVELKELEALFAASLRHSLA